VVFESAQVDGAFLVLGSVGGGKDNDGELTEFGGFADVREDVVTVYAGHLQIEDEQDGEREVGAVVVGWLGFEIVDALVSIDDEADVFLDALAKTSLEEDETVGGVVISDENDPCSLSGIIVRHRWPACFGNQQPVISEQ